jgi:sugar lactone lactonase YvrE
LTRLTIFVLTSIFLLSTLTAAHPGSGIAVGRDGQIFFIDTGSGLWKIDKKGIVTQLSRQRFHWLAIDNNDSFPQDRLPSDSSGDWVIASVGSKPTLLISSDFPIAVGQVGDLYYPSGRPGDLKMMRRDSAGKTTVFARLPNGTSGTPLVHINGITADANGSIYYTEDGSIRRIDGKGSVTTVATVKALSGRPSIPGIELSQYLRGVAVDGKGNVYVADSGDARVLMITPQGKVTTLLQLAGPWSPTDVALAGDEVYVLEYLHAPGDDRLVWMPRIRKISPDGKSTIVLTVDQMPGARIKSSADAPGQRYNMFFRSAFVNPFLSNFPQITGIY